MSQCQALPDWWLTQQRVLDESSALLADVNPNLLSSLRAGRVGRRMLAQSLAKKAPALFSHPLPDQVEVEPWLSWSTEAIQEVAADLGFWILLPGAAKLIDRKSVAAISDQVEPRRYRRMVGLGCPWQGAVSQAIAQRAQTEIQAGLAERDLRQRIARLGLHELRAKCQAPGAVERLVLVFGADISAGALAWLPQDAYQRYWACRLSTDDCQGERPDELS